MDALKRQEKIDAVTVGQIRKRYNETLDCQINTLACIIRQGYFKLPEAEKFLNDTIGRTLSQAQNLDAMASTEINFP